MFNLTDDFKGYTMVAISNCPEKKVLRQISGLTYNETINEKLFPYGIIQDPYYGSYKWAQRLTSFLVRK